MAPAYTKWSGRSGPAEPTRPKRSDRSGLAEPVWPKQSVRSGCQPKRLLAEAVGSRSGCRWNQFNIRKKTRKNNEVTKIYERGGQGHGIQGDRQNEKERKTIGVEKAISLGPCVRPQNK